MLKLIHLHTDKRGFVASLLDGENKILLIQTFKNFLRGGEIHSFIQQNFLLTGKAKVITKFNGKNIENIYVAPIEIIIDKDVPHYFIFLEDSFMTEAYDITGGTTVFHAEFRKLVEDSFK